MEVTPGTVHDHARFTGLVKAVSVQQTFEKLLADPRYLSRDACAAAKAAGVTPYIQLKASAVFR